MKEALAWQMKEEVALKLQEVDGAVEADTAVKDDAAMDPEEVRIKKQASVHAKVCPEMKVEDWPLVSSNLDVAGVLTRRAHPPEVRSSDLVDPEIEQLKTT